jgi:hypothetical protein
MSTTVGLTAQETAERLLPVLRDYAGKLGALNGDAAAVLPHLHGNAATVKAVALNAARLICLRDTLDKPVRSAAQNASGLLEHAELEHVTRLELKLRLDELEEHYRFSGAMVTSLRDRLLANRDVAAEVRKQVETTRYKAPF